jgi:bifunctional DNA-binding transcriptional regulator/antitoxin component of YhaV-PrlF toxin-antitoxin module
MARRVRETPIAYGPIRALAQLRPKNQLTLPETVAAAAGVEPGDRFLVEFGRDDPDTIRLRRVRDSYAGAFKDLYGDAGAYLEGERASWDEG